MDNLRIIWHTSHAQMRINGLDKCNGPDATLKNEMIQINNVPNSCHNIFFLSALRHIKISWISLLKTISTRMRSLLFVLHMNDLMVISEILRYLELRTITEECLTGDADQQRRKTELCRHDIWLNDHRTGLRRNAQRRCRYSIEMQDGDNYADAWLVLLDDRDASKAI